MEIQLKQLDVADFPELEEDPYHPQNDQCHRNQEQVKRVIMAHQRQMTPKHVQIVKLAHAGHKQVKIAELTKVSPTTVSKVLQRPEAQRLRDLLNYLQASTDGMTANHRAAMLNRIAKDNEKNNPKVAIAAMAEMRSMEQHKHNMETNAGGPPQVNITINQDAFPRTVLDG